jgi:hypothetical protein
MSSAVVGKDTRNATVPQVRLKARYMTTAVLPTILYADLIAVSEAALLDVNAKLLVVAASVIICVLLYISKCCVRGTIAQKCQCNSSICSSWCIYI